MSRAGKRTLGDLLYRPEVRLLTLTRPGGVGKTRLAVGVAESVRSSFADGVVVVPLASLHDASLLIQTGARTLDLPGADVGFDALARFLSDKRLLLVLDNFEYLMDSA